MNDELKLVSGADLVEIGMLFSELDNLAKRLPKHPRESGESPPTVKEIAVHAAFDTLRQAVETVQRSERYADWLIYQRDYAVGEMNQAILAVMNAALAFVASVRQATGSAPDGESQA